jgi:hypothetical protein
MATILKQVDIRTVPSNLNLEQVMQEIVDISRIPLPFQSMVGTTSHSNQFFEWSCDRLAAPSLTNRVVDGSTAPTAVTTPAVRLGNNSQISSKTVATSIRANSSNNVGNEGLARQLSRRTQELDQDIDAMLLQNIANVADDGASNAGVTAGLETWFDLKLAMSGAPLKSTITSNATVALTTGTGVAGSVVIKGWSSRAGFLLPILDYTLMTATGALSFSQLKSVLNGLYALGANPTKIMGVPDLISRLSQFMFTSTAQIATPILNVDAASNGFRAQSAVNSMVSDFGIVVDFVPNRLQPNSGDGAPTPSATLFVFDPSYLQVSWQGGGIKTQELATTGLSKSIQMYGDYGLVVKNPDALGGIVGLTPTAAVVA